MITHIVFFKLIDNSKEKVEELQKLIMGMNGKIEFLRHLEAGIDMVRSERSYDLALVSKFDNLDDLNAYQVHPVHVEVAKYIAKVKESAVSVDYES